MTLQQDHDARIAVLENSFYDMKATHKEMMDKLDELLALKNRGMGVFWLASTLFGTVLVGIASNFTSWFKSLLH